MALLVGVLAVPSSVSCFAAESTDAAAADSDEEEETEETEAEDKDTTAKKKENLKTVGEKKDGCIAFKLRNATSKKNIGLAIKTADETEFTENMMEEDDSFELKEKKRIYFSVHVRYFFMKPQKYRINHMRPNRIYITGILLLFAFLSGRAQQPRIDELECRNLKIGYEKTLHMIFPTPVKYLNMGDENIIGEVIQVCPSVIRLKSTVRDFKGETNLSVVTEDSRYYTYCISFDEGAQAVYKEGGTMPETAVLPVSDEKLTHVIYPEKIVYVDFGNTTVQVEKAENVNNIVALRAVSPFALQTNLTAITESGRFYTFDLRYAPGCERFSFIVDKQDTKKKQVAILEGRERNTRQKALLEKEISRRPKLLTNIRDEVAGMRFCVTNIFVDNDILLFRFGLHNRSQIGYTIDFIRFYIQDAKKRKKTAVQQLEQQPLFSFNRPEEVAALSSCDFTVALPKFTIPDKKVLIIEIQERNGGRHFYYKLKNKQLINAEILFPEIVGKP